MEAEKDENEETEKENEEEEKEKETQGESKCNSKKTKGGDHTKKPMQVAGLPVELFKRTWMFLSKIFK